MTIRAPQPEDIERLLTLGARLHAESAYAFLPFDRGKVQRLIENFITDRESMCGLVAVNGNGELTGMIGGYLTDYFFCEERLACDMVLFVDQTHRGTATAARLIEAFRAWAAGRGAREVSLGVSAEIRPEQVGRFYQWLGFRPAGAIFKQRLDQ